MAEQSGRAEFDPGRSDRGGACHATCQGRGYAHQSVAAGGADLVYGTTRARACGRRGGAVRVPAGAAQRSGRCCLPLSLGLGPNPRHRDDVR